MSTIAPDIKNFNQFKSYVGRYGFSLNNFYDVQFLFANTSNKFLQSIFTKGLGVNSDTPKELMRLYADECTIPGYAVSTGDFRITNTPNMKYAYGIVNNEITMSFISDADSEIRKTFDSWGNFIYSSVSSTGSRSNINSVNINSIQDLGRTRYKDEYVLDIVVIKLERYMSSFDNSERNPTDRREPKKTVPHSRLFPGTDTSSVQMARSGFGDAKQVYSIRLQNCFPTTVSAIPLNSGSSQLVKVQVTFEYDLAFPASQSGDTVDTSGQWTTVAG
jgi:hypothetical protein